MNAVAASLALLTAVCCIAVYLINKRLKPKNIMLAWEPGRGTLQPYPIRSKAGSIKVPIGRGRKVDFPMVPGMGSPRSDGRGQFFLGNLSTGQLMKPISEGTFEFTDGLHNELALADGRAKQLTNAVNGDKDLWIKACVILAVLNLLTIMVLAYKFFQG